eukprot:TRINITY_DN2244_c0_g1_i1.p1 TRINITY_DN2244_c0_g1~~TRINITY_DN2244_c0_g1_i1.p1  ORF type:complete len:217 (+),score=57.53 TRINITY_DN2244_c0_g1_i1:84-734(+)
MRQEHENRMAEEEHKLQQVAADLEQRRLQLRSLAEVPAEMRQSEQEYMSRSDRQRFEEHRERLRSEMASLHTMKSGAGPMERAGVVATPLAKSGSSNWNSSSSKGEEFTFKENAGDTGNRLSSYSYSETVPEDTASKPSQGERPLPWSDQYVREAREMLRKEMATRGSLMSSGGKNDEYIRITAYPQIGDRYDPDWSSSSQNSEEAKEAALPRGRN